MIQELPTDVIGLTGLALMLAFLWIKDRRDRRSHEAQSAAIAVVQDQVANDHDTNLRHELDERHTEIMAQLNRLDERSARIGTELRHEVQLRREADARGRREHTELVERVEDIIARHHPEEVR